MSKPQLTVVVTRERTDASNWVAALQNHGFEVCLVPWLELQDIPAEEIDVMGLPCGAFKAVMFVSARAARVLARHDLPWVQDLHRVWAQGRGPRVWAPGPGTQRQLLDLGVPIEILDTPGEQAVVHDSQSLWLSVQGQIQAGDSILVVRGEDSRSTAAASELTETDGAGLGARNALARVAKEAGAEVHEWVVYRRGPALWSPSELKNWAHALQCESAVWVAGSAMALNHGHALALSQGLSADWCFNRCALTWHPRVQAHAQALGWRPVVLSEPGLDAVTQTLLNLALKRPLSEGPLS